MAGMSIIWLLQTFYKKDDDDFDWRMYSNTNIVHANDSITLNTGRFPEHSMEFSLQMPIRPKSFSKTSNNQNRTTDITINTDVSVKSWKSECKLEGTADQMSPLHDTSPLSPISDTTATTSSSKIPETEAMNQMLSKFPTADINDLERFLIARKGNVSHAADMYSKCSLWRSKHFPVTRSMVENAFRCNCMFVHGVARNGTPVLLFRNATYDKSKASSQEFVLAAAYCMNMALSRAPRTKVTVLIHTAASPGCVNGPADTAFIKAFITVMADNFPESLSKMIIYPFPWMAHVIWSMVKVFIDAKTRSKVQLISGSSREIICRELFTYVEEDQIPESCWGSYNGPLQNPLIKKTETGILNVWVEALCNEQLNKTNFYRWNYSETTARRFVKYFLSLIPVLGLKFCYLFDAATKAFLLSFALDLL
eukprot:gene4387-8735_t